MEAMTMMMEVEDDDVFFAELNREISLLINEDEDDYYDPSTISSDHYPSAVSIQKAFSRATRVYPSAQPQYQSFDHQHTSSTYKQTSTTSDQQSKGTGVFIPKSSPQFTKRRSNKHQPKGTKHVNYYYNNSYNTNKNYKSSSYRQQLPSQGVLAQVLIPKNF